MSTLYSSYAEATKEMNKHIRAAFPDRTPDAGVFDLAEEVGEFVGAYSRAMGRKRRSGDWADVEKELADVVLVAYGVADDLGIDLDKAIEEKMQIVFTRGWKQHE